MRRPEIVNCMRCGDRIAEHASRALCLTCQQRPAKRRPLQTRATHIAGYVPPRGSIAAMFHGRIVQYH